MTKDRVSLLYKRKLSVNGMLFPVTSYAGLKQIFDMVHKEDNHQVTLKFNAATATK